MTSPRLRTPASELPPGLVRTVGQVTSPLWLLSLVAPEVGAAFDELGLAAGERYFPARAAPLGTAPPELVISTFFNFSPAAVEPVIPAVWAKTTPEAVLAAQLKGVDAALSRAFAETGPAVSELAQLLERAAEAAYGRLEGRPLFAAYAALDRPDEPHLRLWHAHYLLREFRGDGHIAALVAEGLTGLEALILHVARVPMVGPVFRSSRAWTDAQWDEVVEGLTADGWLAAGPELAFTEQGRARREAIEERTDELAAPAWDVIGEQGCRRVVELMEPVQAALTAAGLTFSFG